MPKRKKRVFLSVIAALFIVMILSVIMSVHHYEKTILIPLDASKELEEENEAGLKEIRRQLEEAESDSSTGEILWKGAVCMTKYQAWGGRATRYYVCPYLAAVSTDTITEEPSEWTVSLHFAMCAAQGDELVAVNKKFSLHQIELNCRSGKSAAILSAAYNDMDMTEINKDVLSYTFRDKEELTKDTKIYAKLMLISKESLEENNQEQRIRDGEKNSVIVNWAFCLEEDGRIVNNFDGVQIEIPYEMEKKDD